VPGDGVPQGDATMFSAAMPAQPWAGSPGLCLGSPGVRSCSPGTEVGVRKAVSLCCAIAYGKLLLLFADPVERLVGAGRVFVTNVMSY